jgi:leucyl/phenylalanyl-tRNA--protein transferase
MIDAYCELHTMGHAHSVEAWEGEELVGGLYGVSVGAIFCGESMFARESDASKVAFVYLVRQLENWGFQLIDCQVYTEHLERFGAEEVRRTSFLDALTLFRDRKARIGAWEVEVTADEVLR